MISTPQQKAQQRRATVLESLKLGDSLEQALKAAGISRQCYYTYRYKHKDWAEAIEKAIASPAVEVVDDDGLTTKQRLWVEAYIANPNATEAARKAGYGGNEGTLGSIGSENLQKPAIRALLEKRIRKAVMSADEVLAELADIAKAEWREFIEVVKDREGNIIDVKMNLTHKIKAIELIGKYHKMFTDKVEHSGKDGGPIQVRVIEPYTDPLAEMDRQGLTEGEAIDVEHIVVLEPGEQVAA